jgi:hypothetical protein
LRSDKNPYKQMDKLEWTGEKKAKVERCEWDRKIKIENRHS